jgi:hypothetical protein
VVTYLAKAESNSGVSCQGVTYAYTITVNQSLPSLHKRKPSVPFYFFNSPLRFAGKYCPSWHHLFMVGACGCQAELRGGAALANQTTIKGTLINPTNDVRLHILCNSKNLNLPGPSFTAVVTVNPFQKFNFRDQIKHFALEVIVLQVYQVLLGRCN